MTAFILKPHMQRWYRAARSGGAFHPTQIPGLVALYDISDLSTLFVERTGASASTPASVDGVVGTVLDLSGKGNHLIAPSDAARPVLKKDGSLYYLDFDGVDDCFQCANFTISNRFYICLGVKQDAADKFFFVEHSPNSNTSDGFFFDGTSNSAWLVRRAALHRAPGVSNWAGTDPAVAELVYRTSGQFYRKNGVTQNNGGVAGSLADQSNVTATLNVFSRNAASLFSDARLYTLMLVDGDISDDDATKCREWAASKTGVTL